MAELFGFKITRAKEEEGSRDGFTTPSSDDGAIEVSGAGHFASVLDLEGKTKSDDDLIRKYRDIAQQSECDMAVEDIVNEAIVADEADQSVALILEYVPVPENIKVKIREEFDKILSLLYFQNKGHDIFRRWYVDGRLYYHMIIDKSNPKLGIKEVRYIDPRKIKKVRQVNREKDNKTGVDHVKNVDEFYVYNEKGLQQGVGSTGVQIAADSIAYCTSGLVDQNSNRVLSHLHKAIKPVNQLRMIEDALVIYRISRAPERRIFRIDVGNLPKVKAEQYLRDVMNRYRNKLVYDASTGEIRDGRNHLSMLEDFWLPIREGGRGTDVQTLPGGQNLGEIEDIKYFQKRLYRSLNVPVSRLTEESPGTVVGAGRSSEVTRDELKFTKFVQRLRKKFTGLFLEMLRTQLILKGIINDEDWQLMKERVNFNFIKDGHFSELKDAELLQNRIDTLDRMQSYIGTFYSKTYVQKYVLRLSDTDISRMKDEIKQESGEGELNMPDGSDGVTRYPTLPPGSTQIDMTKTDDDDEEENGDTQQPPQDEPENEGEL